MLSAGLDVGALWTKAVVLEDGALAGWHLATTGGDTAKAAEDALAAALQNAGLDAVFPQHVVSTGAGKNEVHFAAERATEVMCAARGTSGMHPGAGGVIDMGGESTRVVKLDADGCVLEFVFNDKCAAGTGVFLDAMAKAMDVRVEDMGPLSLQSTADVNISSMCVAFAESEVVSQVHRQTPKQDILKGIHKSIATRIFGMVQRMDLGESSVAIGGLALNTGIVSVLEEMIGKKLIVPEHPQIVSAFGAALIANEQGGAG